MRGEGLGEHYAFYLPNLFRFSTKTGIFVTNRSTISKKQAGLVVNRHVLIETLTLTLPLGLSTKLVSPYRILGQ